MINDYINKIYAYSRHEGLEGQSICNSVRELLQRHTITESEYETALVNLSKVASEYSVREIEAIKDELKSRVKSKAKSSESIVVTK